MRSFKQLMGLILCLSAPVWLFPTGQEEDPGRFNFISGQTKVEIPFYTFNNQVILSVTVNDKVPLNFILDSGTTQAVFFDRKLAQQLGVGFGRKIQFSGVGNNRRVTAFRGRGVKLGLPGVEGHMMGMAILIQDNMEMKRFDIHGTIGYQLFVRFAVKIDYARRVVTLMEPHDYSDTDYATFDLEIEGSKPYINTNICLQNNLEIPLKLMIDTGAAYGLSLINGSHPAIEAPVNSEKIRFARGLGGELKGFKGSAILKLNKDISSKVITYYVNPKDYTTKGLDPIKMGTIGGNLLKNYLVIIDYINAKVHFQARQPDLQSNRT